MFAQMLAWMLPVAAGVATVAALAPRRSAGRFAATAGQGLVFGLLLAALATSVAARADTAHAWRHAAPWLVAVVLVATLMALWRLRHARAAGMPPQAAGVAQKVAKWKMLLVGAALASLIARGWLMAREILLRPTYPWDAWDAWAVKSKAWFLLGHYAPFVDMHKWLARAPLEMYTGPAWDYPSLLAWMQVWFASAAGDWIEPLVNLPWLALWIGLLLGHYGQWRALGLSRLRALAFVYALGSLPLLDTHVALAGYADLWIASVFGFAVLAWLRWLEQRDGNQLALALICTALLPWLKHEGLVWALCLGVAIGFSAIPRRLRWRALLIVLVAVLLLGAIGGLSLLLTVFGWVRSGSHTIELPVVGAIALGWHADAALGVAHGLFVQPNWHLLWWLLPAVVVWRWRALRQSEALSLCGLLLSGCFALLLFLFVFTDAARWAESYTAVNRLVLHLVPALVTWLALLLREAELFPVHAGTTPASAPPRDPA